VILYPEPCPLCSAPEPSIVDYDERWARLSCGCTLTSYWSLKYAHDAIWEAQEVEVDLYWDQEVDFALIEKRTLA
jgi:hypothetical protein